MDGQFGMRPQKYLSLSCTNIKMQKYRSNSFSRLASMHEGDFSQILNLLLYASNLEVDNFLEDMEDYYADLHGWYQLVIALIIAGLHCPTRFADLAIELLFFCDGPYADNVRCWSYNLLIAVPTLSDTQYKRILTLPENHPERDALIKHFHGRVQ
jgi:hypothetical protein